MKKADLHKKIFTHVAIGLVSLVLAMANINSAAAAAGSIYFEQSSIAATKGSQVTLKVKASSASAFNAAQVDISYNSSALEYVSYSMANGVLGSTYDFKQSPGSLRITLYKGSGARVSGSGLHLMSYTFRVAAASGSANVKFMPSSALVSGKNAVGRGSNQATITVQASGTTQQKGQSTAKQSAPETTSGETVVTPPSSDKIAPRILSAVPTGFSSGPISIKVITNEPSKARVTYGTSAAQRYVVSTSSSAKTYLVPLDDITKTFNKDSTYVYQVEVTDDAGNKAFSSKYEFVVKPVTLTLKVQDAEGKALGGQIVVVNNREFTADRKGIVKIKDVIPGTVSVAYKNGSTITHIGNLTAVKGVEEQSFTVSPTTIISTTRSPIVKYIVLVAALAAVLVAGYFLVRRLDVESIVQKVRSIKK